MSYSSVFSFISWWEQDQYVMVKGAATNNVGEIAALRSRPYNSA